MDEFAKKSMPTLIDLIQNSLSKNYEMSPDFATDITSCSLIVDYKLGVLIGETLESSISQLINSVMRHELNSEERNKVLSGMTPLLDGLNKAIRAGNKDETYEKLASIRFYATRQQYEIPTKYTKKLLRGKPAF